MRHVARLLLLGWLVLVAASPAPAVIIAGGDGTGNTVAPYDDPGWLNVGGLNGSSCAYLGDGWVLTASHVGLGTVFLNNNYYSAVPDSLHRLTTTYIDDSGATITTDADIVLFQLQTVPTGLNASAVVHPDQIFYTTTQVTAIGYGKDRAATQTWWASDWSETTDPSATAYVGYKWDVNNNSKRWGTNSLVAAALVDDGAGITYTLVTQFDPDAGDNEMQAARNDSGGGVFYKNGSSWEIAGIMLAIDGVDDKPTSLLETAVFGDTTYFADLRYYSDQIAQITGATVPEPSTGALLLIGGALAWLVWRRRGVRRAV